jgi:hypothetical protein
MLEVEVLIRLSGSCITKAKLRVSAALLGGSIYILLHGLPLTTNHLL